MSAVDLHSWIGFWGKPLEGFSLYLSAHGSVRGNGALAIGLALLSATPRCFLACPQGRWLQRSQSGETGQLNAP